MPARSRKSPRKFKKNRNKYSLKKLLVVFFIVIIGFGLYSFLWRKSIWDGKSKFTFAIRDKSNDVKIVVFEPYLEKVTVVNIPGETEVQVSRKLGTWRLKSLWELGKNEKIGGLLLTETLSRYLKFPTVAYADSGAVSITEGGLINSLKFIFTSFENNISFIDKLKLFFFNLKLGNTKREEIDLADTTYLKKTTLADGNEGYQVLKTFPNHLLTIFSDRLISENQIKVVIEDSSDDSVVGESLSKIVDVLGGKVASISKKQKSDDDCFVSGRNPEIVLKFSNLFDCQIIKNDESVFDIKIKFGNSFAERF